MQAVTAKGQTPASNSPSDIASAINNISTGPDVDISILDKSTYTESEFLNSVCVHDWFDYDLAGVFIGKRVSISNSRQGGSASMDWIIIGYNHDNTSYTFDLWASRAMFDEVQFGSISYYYDSNCHARNAIESSIGGFSSQLQARLQDMTIVSNGRDLISKIKLLSLTEMGISSGSNHPGVEGNVYDKYFTTGRAMYGTYVDLIRGDSSGRAAIYWSRSRNTSSNNATGSYVGKSGEINGSSVTNNYSLIPVIRIVVS